MIKHKANVCELATNKPDGATAFTIGGTPAATGYRAVSAAYASSEQLPYYAHDGTLSAIGANWEWGIATYTAGTLTRTTISESSNGDAAVDFSGSSNFPVITVGWPAAQGTLSQVANESLIPGGRLTLASGVPVTTTDQLAKTTIYYTPYLHNVITLWDGFQWRPIEFSETSVALGTLTANIGYDVFAYLNGSVLGLEFLAWTSSTVRETAVTLQDGRYCKDGDKSRLLLGSFYTATATTTEDSLVNSFLYNMYNQVEDIKKSQNTTGHSYTTSAFREWGGSSAARLYHFNGDVVPKALTVSAAFTFTNSSSTTTTGQCSVGLNASMSIFGNTLMAIGVAVRLGGSFVGESVVGINYVTPTEYGNANVTFTGAYLGYTWKY